jgi:hypothetical protein
MRTLVSDRGVVPLHTARASFDPTRLALGVGSGKPEQQIKKKAN